MFATVTNLYRICGRPPIEAGCFSYCGPPSSGLRTAIDACGHLDPALGRFEDEPEFDVGGDIEFSWRLGDNEHGRFYADVADLVARSHSLSHGTKPTNFYLLDTDHLSGEEPLPRKLPAAYELCELVSMLSRIALVVDGSSMVSGKKLVFVLPAGEKSAPRTLTLTTRIEEGMVENSPLDLSPLRAILSDDNQSALHLDQYRSIFRLAVAEIASRAPKGQEEFEYLVGNWSAVNQKYRFDIDCFASNFSFEKVRIEIAQMEIDFSSKLSAVMGDGAAKFLALPLQLAVVAGIYKTDGLIEGMFLLLGALMVVIIFSGMIHNQQLQLARIDHGFEVVFDQFASKKNAYPQSVSDRLTSAVTGFSKQRGFLKRVLWSLRIAGWIPISVGLALLAWKFHPGFHNWLLDVMRLH